jgi:hypothetical protein
MMKHYRENANDDDQEEIIRDIKAYEAEVQDKKDVFVSAKKLIKTRKIPTESK